jgi:hypothetical protein
MNAGACRACGTFFKLACRLHIELRGKFHTGMQEFWTLEVTQQCQFNGTCVT